MENRAAFINDVPGRASSVDNDVINTTQTPLVRVVDLYASAGFDRGSDHFPVLVQNVTRSIENISARCIRVNNESFRRLINRRRPLFNRCDDRSRNRYWFRSCLSLIRRVRLPKCQLCNHRAGERDYYFFHNASFFDEQICGARLDRTRASSSLCHSPVQLVHSQRSLPRPLENTPAGGRVICTKRVQLGCPRKNHGFRNGTGVRS